MAVNTNADGTVHTGAMIALVPTPEDAARLAEGIGEPEDQLHLTLRYLGKAADWGTQMKQDVIEGVRSLVEGDSHPVEGDGFHVAMLNPGDEESCVVLGVGGDEVDAIHKQVAEVLLDLVDKWDDELPLPEAHKPFVPHITLEYTDDASRVEDLTGKTGSIEFDRIRVAFGGDVVDFHFGEEIVDVESADDELTTGDEDKSVGRVEYKRGAGVRRVRTPAGVRRYKQPIGSIIVSDRVLAKISFADKKGKPYHSGYEGFELVRHTETGQGAYIGQWEGEKGWFATDEHDDDTVIAQGSSETQLFENLNKAWGGDEAAPSTRIGGSDGVQQPRPSINQRRELGDSLGDVAVTEQRGTLKKLGVNVGDRIELRVVESSSGKSRAALPHEGGKGQLVPVTVHRDSGGHNYYMTDDGQHVDGAGPSAVVYLKPIAGAPSEPKLQAAKPTMPASREFPNLHREDSDYPGYEHIKGANGRSFYVYRDGDGNWGADDEDDNLLADGATRDEVLAKLNDLGSPPVPGTDAEFRQNADGIVQGSRDAKLSEAEQLSNLSLSLKYEADTLHSQLGETDAVLALRGLIRETNRGLLTSDEIIDELKKLKRQRGVGKFERATLATMIKKAEERKGVNRFTVKPKSVGPLKNGITPERRAELVKKGNELRQLVLDTNIRGYEVSAALNGLSMAELRVVYDQYQSDTPPHMRVPVKSRSDIIKRLTADKRTVVDSHAIDRAVRNPSSGIMGMKDKPDMEAVARRLVRSETGRRLLASTAGQAPGADARSAYASVAIPGSWVKISAVRRRLKDAGMSDVQADAELRRLSQAPDVEMMPESNKKILTEEDRRHAIRVGGQDAHLMMIEPGKSWDRALMLSSKRYEERPMKQRKLMGKSLERALNIAYKAHAADYGIYTPDSRGSKDSAHTERRSLEKAVFVCYRKAVSPGGRPINYGPVGKPGGRQNWVDKLGGLPKYIRGVANALKATHGESRAIALAVAAMKRWARGGDHVRPQVQAAAAKALAEWQAMKASA